MKGLKELLQMLQEENTKANIKPYLMRLNGSIVDGPRDWDDDYERRQRLREDDRLPVGDPTEELQPQYMVSPKENIWLQMARKGMK